MSSTNSDAELKAIEQLISALEPLDRDARGRVISYVFQRLGLAVPTGTTSPPGQSRPTTESTPPHQAPPPDSRAPQVVDVRTFANEKRPSSQLEKTAVVAFYLTELAPEGERKTEIAGADLTKYQKQAGLGAPTRPRQALFTARDAGYLDSAGHGKYKLNAVGYNFVAHGLPSTTSSTSQIPATRKRAGRKARKKSTRSRKTSGKKSAREGSTRKKAARKKHPRKG